MAYVSAKNFHQFILGIWGVYTVQRLYLPRSRDKAIQKSIEGIFSSKYSQKILQNVEGGGQRLKNFGSSPRRSNYVLVSKSRRLNQ